MSAPAFRRPFRRPFRRLWLALGLLGATASTGLAQAAPGEKIYSAAELKALDRLNDLWLTVRAKDDLDANLRWLRQAGFAAEDIAALEPTLRRLWLVEPERSFGHLTPETVERIQEIDREFTVKLRAARLYLATGFAAPGTPRLSPREVDSAWHRAILRALDYDEIAEFRLLNHGSARKVNAWSRPLALNDLERRTLNEWQRAFDTAHPGPSTGGRQDQLRREANLDLHERIRGLLGDERALLYLKNASEPFSAFVRALEASGGFAATAVLDAWGLEKRFEIARARERNFQQVERLAADTRDQISATLGPVAFPAYLASADARWVYPRVTPVRSAGRSRHPNSPPEP